KNKSHALFYYCSEKQKTLGPCFGYSCEFSLQSNVSNLTKDKKCWCNSDSSDYENPIRTTSEKFSIVDYE
ncbi:23762_t:CDS:1, partial [Dentiscutata erythropus]